MIIMVLIRKYCGDYPDLIDYLGFNEATENIAMEIEEEITNPKALFDPHMKEADTINLIKKGELFQGKVLINRNNLHEGKTMR